MKNKKELENFLEKECKIPTGSYYITLERPGNYINLSVFIVYNNELKIYRFNTRYYAHITEEICKDLFKEFYDLAHPTISLFSKTEKIIVENDNSNEFKDF